MKFNIFLYFIKKSKIIKKGFELEKFCDLLKQLIRVPSVINAETPFFLYIKRELDELGIKTKFYEGILVAKGKTELSGFISAHIDRHGLVCTGPNEFQYAAFVAKNRGELSGKSISEQTYANVIERFISKKIQAYDPWSGGYLGLGTITKAYKSDLNKNLIFEIDGLEHLLPGTPIAYVDKLFSDEEYISAQLDNVISAAMILYLYQNRYEGTAFFTAGEEAGKSWRFLLEWFNRFEIGTDRLLVLDTSPYPDKETASLQDIVLRNRDEFGRFKSPLKKEIVKICKKENISYSFKDEYIKELNKELIENNQSPKSIGITELGKVITASKGNIQGTTLQIPTTGYHTTHETTKMESVQKMLKILEKIYIPQNL
jgi:putative aminopeptidase FrvX